MRINEKAKELVTSFSFLSYDQDQGIEILNPTLRSYSKQCALIAVDEIIKSYTDNLQEGHIDFIDHNPIEYWEQVKSEIK